MLLAATVGGTMAVLMISRTSLIESDEIKVSDQQWAGVTFIPDGKAALVALRDEQGVVVLGIDGDKFQRLASACPEVSRRTRSTSRGMENGRSFQTSV